MMRKKIHWINEGLALFIFPVAFLLIGAMFYVTRDDYLWQYCVYVFAVAFAIIALISYVTLLFVKPSKEVQP